MVYLLVKSRECRTYLRRTGSSRGTGHMAKKKRDIGEEYRLYQEQQERVRAGYIKDEYPQVRELTFQFTFRDPDPVWQKAYSPWDKTMTLRPEHSALFRFDCPYRECVGGGFDLSSPVRQMIEPGKTSCLTGGLR